MKKVIWQVELKENKNEIILNYYLAKQIRIRFVQLWTKYIEIIWMMHVLGIWSWKLKKSERGSVYK